MKEKNKQLHLAILVICIVLYLVLVLLMGPLRQNPRFAFLAPYIGVLNAIQIVLTTTMVTTNFKRGYIATCILSVCSAMSAGISMMQSKSLGGLPGVLLPLSNIATMTIIISYMATSRKQQEELSEQYEKTMDANRIVEEQNNALKIYAYKDLMTNMYNLTYFSQQIEAEIEKNKPLSIIYMDLDNFKSVNDTFGPKTGDVALRLYADRISSYCGNKYVCARTNGDDFAVMIPGEPTEADILNMIEQFRKMLAEPASVQGEMFSITASYGIAAYPRDGKNAEILLDNAIMAVYNAKANGKDRPCFFSQA
ncbi:MAG: GGDEF domain-containing protein [Oscillospiraceae bacterium]|nr:GGDEF domain-containing protein [Oscillospiraceae bacterium]